MTFSSLLRRHRLGAAATGALALAASAPAAAHVDLLEPPPRAPGLSPDPNANLKEGPCGQEENARTDSVSFYEPGQTIEVRWREFVNHRSYYRVAFDPDGDDGFPIFPGPGISAEGDDPSRACPVDGRVILAYELDDRSGGEYALTVQLPDVECERCTLQLIQYMYDTGQPYYFQCADLVLRRGAREDAAAPDAAVSREPAAAFTEFRAAESCSAALPARPRRGEDAPLPSAPLPPSDASVATPATSEDDAAPQSSTPTSGASSSGCGLVCPSRDAGTAGAALGALALALLARRRRAH